MAIEPSFIKKVKRRERTAKKRQATFVAEYVYTKYFDIYKEAAEQFNRLNTKHPHRPDLRKSIEFKNWQRQVKGLPEVKDYKNRQITREIPYSHISLNTEVLKDSDIIQQCPLKVMQLEIPLMNIPADKSNGKRETNHHKESEIEDFGPHERETNHHKESEIEDFGPHERETNHHKESEIEDFGPHERETDHPQETEQVIEEVIAQGDQDDLADVEPSIFDGLSKEIINDMIFQLQDDPNLARIMSNFDEDVCMNVEIGNDKECYNDDDCDLDVDIDIEDALERELDNIFW